MSLIPIQIFPFIMYRDSDTMQHTKIGDYKFTSKSDFRDIIFLGIIFYCFNNFIHVFIFREPRGCSSVHPESRKRSFPPMHSHNPSRGNSSKELSSTYNFSQYYINIYINLQSSKYFAASSYNQALGRDNSERYAASE